MIRLAALAVLFAFAAAGTASADPSLLKANGIVAGGDVRDGKGWFELEQVDQRFTLNLSKVAAAADIATALAGSHKTNRSVGVYFYPDSGHFEPGVEYPVYVVGRLEYDGKTFEGEPVPPQTDPKALSPRDAAAADLARGIALVTSEDVDGAQTALGRAIDSGKLDTELQKLALKTRGILDRRSAVESLHAGTERDDRLASALVDFRAWQALAPDDQQAYEYVAYTISALGGYDDAIALYRDAETKWPKHDFWARIELVRNYRILRQYDKALAELEEIAKAYPTTMGMAYYYHRGWTLNEAGRFDEALAAFDKGLEQQPDYSWALMRRACARAGLGKLREALEDQEQGAKLLGAVYAGLSIQPYAKFDIEHANAVADQLRAAIAKDPNAKLDAPCGGYWDGAEVWRARSALLPPAKP